jgi:hypothetical protein
MEKIHFLAQRHEEEVIMQSQSGELYLLGYRAV